MLLKKLKDKVKQVQEEYSGDIIELWTLDEHRIGLKPIIKRVWGKKGIKEKATVNHRYEWVYIYAYVQPETGKTIWQILSTVNVESFNASLNDFAKNVEAEKGKQIVLIMDRAGWHMSKEIKIPQGIHLEPLPPYSPELQPAERLWSLTDEPLVNKCFNNINDLINVVLERCNKLTGMLDIVRERTLFHWWPKICF